MRWLISIFINAILFVAMAGFFHSFEVASFGSAIVASFILSILNVLVRPILIILTLPITVLTLGIFLLVINAFTLLLTDRIMGDSFQIHSFGMAFLMAVIMSITNIILQNTILQKNKRA
ncbi:phage holin family protein [Bacillus sp. FJAT-49736]|uniref:phage holin family protein n=1 Tax=Bacillus sp. FJAT-49736 TaxID=2833582 RepID=UPI001BCA5A0A|nr:phage holin family protein [Bacillus sp. FJAT-49736]MBS4174048.1 phage holin family protein [Bacillus sp. FJAT-49736]